MRLFERFAVLHRRQHIVQLVPRSLVVVHVAGAHDADADPLGQRRQATVALCIAVDQMVLQLNEDLVRAEGVQPTAQLALRSGQLAGRCEIRQLAATPANQQDQSGRSGAQVRGVQPGLATALILGFGVVEEESARAAEQLAEIAVALAGLGQHGHVRARSFLPVADGQLGAGDGADAALFERLGELQRAVQAVVVGQRERRVAQFGGALGQLIDARSAIKEREAAMQVELDVGGVAPLAQLRRRRFGIGLAVRARRVAVEHRDLLGAAAPARRILRHRRRLFGHHGLAHH